MRGERATWRATTELLALGVVVAATLWYALALGWCLFARVGAGHDALTASRGIMADNMIRWGIWGPVREYTIEPPGVDLYYTHHPFGTYWMVGLLARVFGRHAFVPRLGPVLMSIATPPLIYAIGRRIWDPVSGALAAAGYVVLPMTLAFGNLAGFEVPTVFACIVTTWGYVRFTERWQRRWMLVSLLGVAWGCSVDWNYVLFLGFALGAIGIGAFFLPPRAFARVPRRPLAQWWLLAAAVATISVVAWVWYFHKIGALEGLLQSDTKRSKGSEFPIVAVVGARRYWIDVTFTPLAIVVGKIALPILLLRTVVGRRWHEVFPLAIWFMAFVTYTKFKNGADVHIYWPFAFGAYFAFALGVVARAALVGARWILARLRREDTRERVPLVVLGALGLVPLGIVPDGIEGLHYGRQTGGRFNEKGTRSFRDVDKAQALEWMSAQMAPDTIVEMHDGMKSTWALDWALRRKIRNFPAQPTTDAPPVERYFVADLDLQPSIDQQKMAELFKVVVVDHFVMVDRAAPKGPADAYVFDTREPTFLEWYLTNGTEPVRTIRPDPWATWEVRDAWGQTPNPPPTGEPRTLEQLRIAHNVALSRGDPAGALRLEQQLVVRLDTSVAAGFNDGTRLVGEKYVPGVLPELTLIVRASGPAGGDFELAIESTIDKRRTCSMVPYDDRTQHLGAPFPLPPRLWRAGYLYAEHAPIHHRAGREHFIGRFTSLAKEGKAPRLINGQEAVPLLTLE